MSSPNNDWTLRKCGDDSGWSALLADAEKHLAKAGFTVYDDSLSSADFCPECF